MLTGGSSAHSGLVIFSSVSLNTPLPLQLLRRSRSSPLSSIHMESLDGLFHHGAPSDMKPCKCRPFVKKDLIRDFSCVVHSMRVNLRGLVWIWRARMMSSAMFYSEDHLYHAVLQILTLVQQTLVLPFSLNILWSSTIHMILYIERLHMLRNSWLVFGQWRDLRIFCTYIARNLPRAAAYCWFNSGLAASRL